MKTSIVIIFLTIISFNSFGSTLVKCVVPNPRNVLTLEIDDSYLQGTITELNGLPVKIESGDGKTFSGNDFFGVITFAPGINSSPSSRTLALLVDQKGNRSLLNCMKKNSHSNIRELVEIDWNLLCRVPKIDLGVQRRNYDYKFRACRAKGLELSHDLENQRACAALCMKN